MLVIRERRATRLRERRDPSRGLSTRADAASAVDIIGAMQLRGFT